MVASRSHSALAVRPRPEFFCHPSLESLEGRLLMAGLAVPQLSSRPGAAASIYLDFDGHTQASWGSFSNIVSPAYSRDTDLANFSSSDLTGINDIWTRVAEDFAPFNVNVTTVEPASFADGVALRVVIGGKSSDWSGSTATGQAFLNSFTNSDPNVAYVFSGSLSSGFPKWVSEAVSRQAGAALGLHPQAKWSGSVLQEQFSTGTGEWAPIMGNGNFAQRSTWNNGPTDVSPTSFQDDMAIIAGSTNGFGYVADDYGDTLAGATQLPISGTSVNLTGLVGQNGDQDVFKFTTAGGDLSFNLAVARVGANLDSVLELRDANGQVVTIANDPTSGVYTSALSANVAAGTYYLIVRSSGGYGNVGQYTLTGTVVPGVVTAPEISVLVGGVELGSGGGVSFGSTLVGTPVMQTFTVQNFGNGDLTLSPVDGSAFPAGFSLATNLGATTLAPGQSTTFTVQLDAAAAGSFGGMMHVLSNDADEGSFDLVLGGTVTAPIVRHPEIRVWGDSNELQSGDALSFGPTLQGHGVSHTFTVQNVGDGDLALGAITQSSLPAGYTLAQDLAATTLHPTDFITFVVHFDGLTAGTSSGVLGIHSNDEDEGSFDVTLSGMVTAPEIRVFAGSTELASGGSFDFGSTSLGMPVSQTFTIHNAGDGNLVASAFDGSSLPAGFSLVAGFGDATVAPGSSIILTVQLNAAAAGAFGGTIHVLSSDADESSFDIALSGLVTAPEISITGSPEIFTGETFELGTTLIGNPVQHTFIIHNLGDGDLFLSTVDASSLPAGITLVSNISDTTVAPGGMATFTVQLDATARGTFSGSIHVLNNDADEGSFDIGLHGVVTAPEIHVFAGGVELFSGDLFNFTAVVGAPLSQTFTIQNAGDGDLAVSPLDGSSLPAGFTLVSNIDTITVAPGSTATFTVQFDASAKGAFSGAIHLLSSDADEASFDVVLSGLATAPEISVFVGGTELLSGQTVDFGTTQTGTPQTRTVTVTNVGDATLVLTPIDATTLPAGFSLVSGLSATTLAAGESATFTLRLDAAAAGSPSGMIHLVSNDGDEGSFDLALQGVVNDPPPPPAPTVKTIDNGEAGFTATGNWHVQKSKGGFGQDSQFAEKGEKNDKKLATATWTFTGLQAGFYRVSVTAPSSPSYASDAPFSVLDGATLLRTVLVNQKKAPGDFTADGVKWQKLGVFTIQGGTLVVQLTNRANGHVVADAVRIQRVASADDPGFTPDAKGSNKHDGSGAHGGSGGGSHKPSPDHRHAGGSGSHGKGELKRKSHDQDKGWLHDVATDVAHHRASRKHK